MSRRSPDPPENPQPGDWGWLRHRALEEAMKLGCDPVNDRVPGEEGDGGERRPKTGTNLRSIGPLRRGS